MAAPPLREENLAMDLLNDGVPFEDMDLSAYVDIAALSPVNQSRTQQIRSNTLKLGNLVLIFCMNATGVLGLGYVMEVLMVAADFVRCRRVTPHNTCASEVKYSFTAESVCFAANLLGLSFFKSKANNLCTFSKGLDLVHLTAVSDVVPIAQVGTGASVCFIVTVGDSRKSGCE